MLYLSLLPGSMKKIVQLTYIAIGLEVFDDGPMFFDITRHQERDSLFINIEQKKRKRKYTS